MFQQLLAVLAASEGVGQVAAQAVGDRQGQQRILDVDGQALEHHAQQVVTHRRLVAAEQL